MQSIIVLLLAATPALALDVLPPHLRGGSVGAAFSPPAPSSEATAKFVTVPLDHNDPEGPTWRLKFFVDDSAFAPGGALLVEMPSEGATTGCYAGTLAKELKAAAICSQHRYFGDSVPGGDSSTAALSKYMSVEQNLADIASLIAHARATLFPAAGATVVQGGSYAGASSAWMRQAYPRLVDAAIAQSPPITAKLGFPEYDTSNLVALSSPDSRCARTQARVASALTSLLDEQPHELMELFGAPFYATAAQGLTDFMYALGDSAAAAVQYGRKELLCTALKPIYAYASAALAAPAGAAERGRGADERWLLASVFANYTADAWGSSYFTECFYNSTCMRDAVRGPSAEAARSW